jgi:hypothetical protein
MSSKRIVKKATVDPKQGSITSLFGAAKQKNTETKVASTSGPVSVLTSSDPVINEFYESLTPYERIAHEIAVEKLGTSYDVTRTRGFQKWYSTRAKST